MVKGSGIAFQNGDQTLQAVLCGVGGRSFGAGHTVAAEADDGFAAGLGIVFGNGNACAVVFYPPTTMGRPKAAALVSRLLLPLKWR